MKFFCSFIGLLVFGTFAIIQAQEKPKAYKFFEFGKISDKLLAEKVEAFRFELVNIRSNKAEGLIIHYRKPSKIKIIDKKIRESLPHNCGYDGEICGRMRFFDNGNPKIDRTEFWIVPEGAEPPIPNSID